MTACPMCRATEQATGDEVPWADLWAAYEAMFRIEIPAAVRAAYQVGDSTRLGACCSCGLRYFSPAIAGGPDFYELLQSGDGYYDPIKWEARVVASLIEPDEAVADFGAGDGGLLRNLGERTGRSVGVDHNPSAVAVLASHGIEGSTDDFEVFAEREAGAFDVACAMQVLEHVPDVAPLVHALIRVLRPGGRIFIAVPNHERDRDPGFEPLDHPPHHVSRWTEADFHTLADRFGLRVVNVWREPAQRQAFRRALEQRIPGRRSAWFLSRAVARVTPPVLAVGMRKSLAPDASPDGHTLLVELTNRSGA